MWIDQCEAGTSNIAYSMKLRRKTLLLEEMGAQKYSNLYHGQWRI
jgi:hypothetical protein